MGIIGKHKLHFTQVDSTNTEAKRLIEKGNAKEGTLITADYQTHGRGQYGRNWDSQIGQNVIMSLVLSPIFLKIKDQFLLNMCVSLAVANTVRSLCGKVTVKWPNDIYVGQAKISGILIQNFIQATTIKHTIVGIGLNVNQKEWPADVVNATSLSIETKSSYAISEIVQLICEHTNVMYDRLQLSPKSLLQEYEEYLFRKNEIASFSVQDNFFSGIIRGVDDIGRLIVEQDGIRAVYLHGEIQHVIN